jgi:DNA-binding transcriptional regulator YbjK
MSEFLQQDDARKSRILEAALIEFADKGYKKASTNTIVREAGVSKGLLFHYFISKKELFILLYTHAIETITNELYENVNFADKDVLNRVKEATLVKIESYNNHPLFMKLFEKIELVDDQDILEKVYALNNKIQEETYDKLFSNIDYYAFKDTLNIDRCLQVVRWTVDTISADWRKENNGVYSKESFEVLSMDITHYLDLFRESFYR